MTVLSISTILGLVGDLKDNDPAQKRFRDYLEKEVVDVGLLRDFINESLANTGDQYNFAFQDLIVYLGKFLGFQYEYGRYRGATDVSGHDGIWFSHDEFSVVIEVKKTEAYAIKTDTLVGYVDRLISDRTVTSWDCALGLYVVGKLEPDLKQLENSIVAQKRTGQLRVVSAEALMSLAEIASEFDVSYDDIISIIKPAKPIIDPAIDLLVRVVAPPPEPPDDDGESPTDDTIQYWMTPCKSTKEQTAEECIQSLVGNEKIYAFGDKTPGRTSIKVGDYICFYASGKGIVAHALVNTLPEKKRNPKVKDPDRYPWIFGLKEPKLYFDKPIIIDAEFRSRLQAFEGKDPVQPWGWFVVTTRRVSAYDFSLLTRIEKPTPR